MHGVEGIKMRCEHNQVQLSVLQFTQNNFTCQNHMKTTRVYSNVCPIRCNVTQFILSGNCSTCFGWYHHPSSGAQTTVSTASGICHTSTATCHYISNKMQCYTFYFIWKLLYMFPLVPPLIIRSANNCIYSIWYLSDRHYYLPL
jgi:hypothetical protein